MPNKEQLIAQAEAVPEKRKQILIANKVGAAAK